MQMCIDCNYTLSEVALPANDSDLAFHVESFALSFSTIGSKAVAASLFIQLVYDRSPPVQGA